MGHASRVPDGWRKVIGNETEDRVGGSHAASVMKAAAKFSGRNAYRRFENTRAPERPSKSESAVTSSVW